MFDNKITQAIERLQKDKGLIARRIKEQVDEKVR